MSNRVVESESFGARARPAPQWDEPEQLLPSQPAEGVLSGLDLP